MAHYLALTCEALARTVYAAAATSPHTVTVRLLRQGLHDTPKRLRAALQVEIDAVSPENTNAILLAYGLCGLSTAGLVARQVPLVIPRAHDCITLYLGSRARYQEEFNAHPGTYWYSVDYLERRESGSSMALGASGLEATEALYEEYVQKYGEDHAEYLISMMRQWRAHYTRAVFIDMGAGDPGPYETEAQQHAQNNGWEFERRQGDSRLITALIHGEWNNDEFLIVPPGYRLAQSATEGIIEAQKVEPEA